jgi:pullulanase/glycogen debranching enzyme
VSSSFNNIPLGNTVKAEGTYFRFFCPKAEGILLEVYHSYSSDPEFTQIMSRDEEGIWNAFVEKDLTGYFYAYRITPPLIKSAFFMESDYPIADPYSLHVGSKNHYLQYPRTKIIDTDFDWEGDHFVCPDDPRDLIIYEAHIKDMIAHPSAGSSGQGAYLDFIDAKTGGLQHLKRIGVNAVEFLPLQKFAYFEPPFGTKVKTGVKNTWNHYSRNHWGYMTSFFLAPETIYASGSDLKPNHVVGGHENAVYELKNLVKTLHKEGFTVLMDVVYNHASHYDLNPLKYADKEHYFRLDQKGVFQNDSWTGNDIRTEAKFARKLIVDSVKYWASEYHIDGFRFDLAGLIDWETIDLIRDQLKKINPKAILIAEPWGGEYRPQGLSHHGWASWNDRIRNGIKGHNPDHGKGYIFGEWIHGYNRFTLENLIRGTLEHGNHGLFTHASHSVNYVESHDGYTLGDFIRIGLNKANRSHKYRSSSDATRMNEEELRLAKLAALYLFVSQGITMIHSGQEWGRAKVIHDPSGLDPNMGKLDHDSYNKDNGTNWLNFDDISLNKKLFDYYRGLIRLRKNSAGLRRAEPHEIEFKVYHEPLHITFSIDSRYSGDPYRYFISLNGHSRDFHNIVLPKGDWELVVDANQAGNHPFDYVSHNYLLKPSTGVILRQLR